MRREGWRQRFDAASGPVVKGSGESASGHGYNPYRSGGKFASGPHKEKPKGPGRAPGAAAAKPKRAKFNAEPHKQVIAAHKALETHHRGESLRLAGEMKALKEQAKATKPRSAERASLKEQHAALKAQRDEHKAKATASRTERIAASKEMQTARKEHAAGHANPPSDGAPPAKHQTEKPAETAAPATETKFSASFKSAKHEAELANDAAFDGDTKAAAEHSAAALQHMSTLSAHGAAEGLGRGHVLSQEQKIKSELHEVDKVEQLGAPVRGQGDISAREYRGMADSFAGNLTHEQRLAVKNYSDHTDHILNPMLRGSGGAPPAGAKLYQGKHAPKSVHQEREAKFAENAKATAGDGAKALAHDKTMATEMKNLDGAIAAHTFDRDVTTYRVMRDEGGKIMGNVAPGSVIQDHGYVSTTSDRRFLNSFYKGDPKDRVDIHVTVKAGAHGAPVARLSTYANEREVLLPRGSQFRVTKVIPASGGQAKQVHVETI